ncbi:MAG: GNAT family N-acetyltransferase [Rhodospirillales bacterium]|nr:GNAT family N-acetyltransferase [Rhodospirillales bacterium]
MITLRIPREDELSALSALCLRSKAHWGYDDDFMAACVEELTLRPAELTTTQLQLAEDEQGYLGVAQVALEGDKTASLEVLFIEPERMGCGAGRRLFDWAVKQARALGSKSMMIEADPDAAPFYRHMGAYDVGEAPSGSIPGRLLPLLKLDL